MRARCPSCGLVLEREEGYFLGAMLLNVLVAEVLCVLGILVLLLRTWPNPPWQLLQWAAPAAAALLPIAFYPLTKSVWLALDLLVQPARADDSEGGQPPRATGPGSPAPPADGAANRPD